MEWVAAYEKELLKDHSECDTLALVIEVDLCLR
jgi:hypothetical protein